MQDAIKSFDPEEAIWQPFENAKATELVDKMLYADTSVRLPDHPVMISEVLKYNRRSLHMIRIVKRNQEDFCHPLYNIY